MNSGNLALINESVNVILIRVNALRLHDAMD